MQHLEPLGFEFMDCVIAFAFSLAIELAGRLWYTIIYFYNTWPYKLVRLVCDDMTQDERDVVAKDLFCLSPVLHGRQLHNKGAGFLLGVCPNQCLH